MEMKKVFESTKQFLIWFHSVSKQQNQMILPVFYGRWQWLEESSERGPVGGAFSMASHKHFHSQGSTVQSATTATAAQ